MHRLPPAVLRRTLPSEFVSFQQAELAYARLGNANARGEYLDSLPREDLEPVISGLEAYEGSSPEESVVPASVTLLDRTADMPEGRNRGMFNLMRPEVVVTRVVIRLAATRRQNSSRASCSRDQHRRRRRVHPRSPERRSAPRERTCAKTCASPMGGSRTSSASSCTRSSMTPD